MRSFGIFFVLAVFLFSCDNSVTDKNASEADSSQNAGTAGRENKGPRTITDAVNDLKTILERKNKNDIAELIDFPAADTVMQVFLDDSAFQKTYRKNGDKMTKPMFMYYFDTIARFTYLDEITNIFKHVPADSLQYAKELEKEFSDKNQPCTQRYSLSIQDTLVTLTYGSNSNPNYNWNKKGKKEEYPEACEFTSIWIFRFDGNRLRLLRQTMAG
jgi:hypothetical protein